MTNWQKLEENPADSEANIGVVMKRLQCELNNFRTDVSLMTIERHDFDGKIRWGLLYGHEHEVMGTGDTLVEAVIQALPRSGYEYYAA